ncbi:phage tail protein [Bacillus cereus]|nr:phage tail protein [Bacillus cereus]
MSSFGARGLTNKGISLQAKAQAGAELKYTKFVLGDGYLGGQSIAALTNVISPKKTADIARLKMTPPNQAKIGFVLSNQDISTGFYFRELGLYAIDPDEGEILYWYGNAGETADYIPPKGGSDIIAKNFDVLVLVGQATNVTAIINESLVYATHDDVAESEARAKAYTDQKVDDIDLSNITPESIGAAKQADLDAHATDAVKHITAAERTSWNAKETTDGAQEKANQAEANAKNASLPRSGGTITGGLVVNGALTVQSRNIIKELDSVKQAGVERKAEIAGAINAKGVPASASDDWSTLANKIGLIQTEKGTTNLAQNFWSSVYRNTVSGKFCFMDGKIISAYSKQVDTTTRFGRREVDYNGTILNEREFVNESYNPGGLLRGVIASPGMVARYDSKNKQIEVYNDIGTLLYRIPYDSGSVVSDIILARGGLFFYNARNGKLYDSVGNILVSLFEETFYDANQYAAYFVDVNTLVVDTAGMSATIRWYNGAWRVDSTSNNSNSYAAMYLAALAAR